MGPTGLTLVAANAPVASRPLIGRRQRRMAERFHPPIFRVMLRVSLLTTAVLLISSAAGSCADTNAPAFRFHPELADMTNLIGTPVVLTNSPLLGMTSLQLSNHFAKTGFHWKTNEVAIVATGYRQFPHHPGYTYIWEREFILTFAYDRVTKVEVCDRPGGCVVIEERKP